MGYRHKPLSQRLGLSFNESSYWKVSMAEAECFMYFVAALRQVFSDSDVLYLEGTELDPEMESFYLAHEALSQSPVQRLLRHPKAKLFHVSLAKEAHKALSQFATCKTFAQICDAMMVYGGGKILMDGSRIGERIALFSGEIPEPKIKKFCATKVHGDYEWVEEGKDLG
jgi:hypothetical protein